MNPTLEDLFNLIKKHLDDFPEKRADPIYLRLDPYMLVTSKKISIRGQRLEIEICSI